MLVYRANLASLIMLTFITLPSDFTANIASTTTDTISSFSSFIILIIGVLLAGVVIEIIIGSIRHK
jgi:hypothetical protein